MLVRIGLLVILLACGACSARESAVVHGIVQVKDSGPLVGASVVARSKVTGDAVSGVTDADGRFELGGDGTGIPLGEYDVIIVENQGPIDAQRRPSIAYKYRSAGSSGLTLNLTTTDDQKVDWVLDPS